MLSCLCILYTYRTGKTCSNLHVSILCLTIWHFQDALPFKRFRNIIITINYQPRSRKQNLIYFYGLFSQMTETDNLLFIIYIYYLTIRKPSDCSIDTYLNCGKSEGLLLLLVSSPFALLM